MQPFLFDLGVVLNWGLLGRLLGPLCPVWPCPCLPEAHLPWWPLWGEEMLLLLHAAGMGGPRPCAPCPSAWVSDDTPETVLCPVVLVVCAFSVASSSLFICLKKCSEEFLILTKSLLKKEKLVNVKSG